MFPTNLSYSMCTLSFVTETARRYSIYPFAKRRHCDVTSRRRMTRWWRDMWRRWTTPRGPPWVGAWRRVWDYSRAAVSAEAGGNWRASAPCSSCAVATSCGASTSRNTGSSMAARRGTTWRFTRRTRRAPSAAESPSCTACCREPTSPHCPSTSATASTSAGKWRRISFGEKHSLSVIMYAVVLPTVDWVDLLNLLILYVAICRNNCIDYS